MLSVLENQALRQRARPLSLAEYHALGELGFLSERTELIEGMVLEKMPKSPLHTTTVLRLLKAFSERMPTGLHLRSEQPLTLERSEPEPDLAVVAGSVDDYASAHPRTAELVIEVSVSTLAEDRAMAEIYASAGIPEFWLFNLGERSVERYSNLQEGLYGTMEVYSAQDRIALKREPSIFVNLSAIFPVS
ncbi:MAG: Uma2 family endonuclease [Spirochaetales bacterium]|nr:Uma2 family endonuclease [Spirochaetales bacterium]